mmetsp:Transcript_25614/g.39370  ORF Transcript_25614/g.39370 Transcript_25614/m.39370 type:complete len:310 (+) Transcript_25614:143-1072(+)|eukprot:CAMPEP_0195305018 /NCGR_PEP_ID=MMETSP0707-20130614/35550_1 /TAXON_ID=33640 /ORGANISM="Asterionellopsis glacialis, Strain CCMP134" /LENGTH=309 /DNA_ID=CAMNT_0040369019 /DNA_START=54 /DNA_END=983 /DNA_ORIENTATION=-
MSSSSSSSDAPLIGVLALQGAFEEHQQCLEAVGVRTVQVRTPQELDGLDGIVLPGGESTAMGLIGRAATFQGQNMWEALQDFAQHKPTWGTCAGMILLAEKCVGASAVIENGQSLIGGTDIFVCRNYFGSQISSFEMATPGPPGIEPCDKSYPGVFIRAPAILSAGPGVEVLGRVVATPCRQGAVVLQELERKIAAGENVVMMGVVDALERKDQGIQYRVVTKAHNPDAEQEEKKSDSNSDGGDDDDDNHAVIELPGAADGTNAREVISAVRKDHVLCTAFHPELTKDYRWHQYFANMVKETVTASTSS